MIKFNKKNKGSHMRWSQIKQIPDQPKRLFDKFLRDYYQCSCLFVESFHKLLND